MKRPYIPLSVKLEAALLQLGLDPKTAILDHHPPVANRIVLRLDKNGEPDAFEPDANDPRYLQWLGPEANKIKTTGRRGTSKLSKRGGDISEIAKTKRLEEKRINCPFKECIQPVVCLKKTGTCIWSDTPTARAQPKAKRKYQWPKRKIPSRKMRR